MTTPTYVVVLVAAGLLIWLVTVIDISTRRGLSGLARAVWLVAVTLLFPTTVLWYLTRPVEQVHPVRLDLLPDDPDGPAGPATALVSVVIARQRGRISRVEYAERVQRVFGASGPG
jgi:hypothetical protein